MLPSVLLAGDGENTGKIIPGESSRDIQGCPDSPRLGADFISEVHHQCDVSADNKLNAVIERTMKKSEERMNAFCDGLREEFMAK